MRLDKTIRKQILNKLIVYRFAAKCTDLRKRVADLAEKIYVNTVLNSTTTTEGLIAKWPEIEPFLTDLKGYIKQLPALPTTILNELLDLPVS